MEEADDEEGRRYGAGFSMFQLRIRMADGGPLDVPESISTLVAAGSVLSAWPTDGEQRA